MKAVFVVPPQVHILDLTGPAHLFYEAKSLGAAVELVYCTLATAPADTVSSCSLTLAALTPFDRLQLQAGDYVFVPGLDASLLLNRRFYRAAQAFLQWLVNQHASGATICAVCTGAFILGESGLLDGKECTTHWKYTGYFRQQYPTAKVRSNRLFIRDGRIYTSAGVAAGIDLALYIMEVEWGPRFASLVAKEVVFYFRRTPDDPQLTIFAQYRNHLEERIHRVQDTLTQEMGRKHRLEELAAAVNMSARNMSRLFKKATGLTIGAYQSELRVSYAAKLPAEGYTHRAAALECGLRSTRQLRRLVKKTDLS